MKKEIEAIFRLLLPRKKALWSGKTGPPFLSRFYLETLPVYSLSLKKYFRIQYKYIVAVDYYPKNVF
jgi:hypothetical protein